MIKWTKKNRWLYWVLVVASLLVVFLCSLWKSRVEEGFEQNYIDPSTIAPTNSAIPNIIWTFWDDMEMPPFVEKCIGSWQKFNPDYTIIVLNRKNVREYLPEIDLMSIPGTNDMVQRFADFVRAHALAKYGGFWFDASIICQGSNQWMHDIQNETGAEYIGYYTDRHTLPEYRKTSPIIENWCFACIPQSQFVQDWRDEFMRLTTFESPLKYVEDLQANNVNLQNLPYVDYLTMHCSAQKVLQRPGANYKMHYLKAEDTAFRLMVDDAGVWSDEHAVKSVLEKKFTDQPLLKLIGDIRRRIIAETDDYDSLFI